jgi:dTMP kinase
MAPDEETMSLFVTFEGIDGSGKSTIARRVADELQHQGHQVVLTAEPTKTPIGEFVNTCIRTGADPYITAFSFIADRIQHCAMISQWLAEDNIVICDRYAESTYAYQGAQLQGQIRTPIKWLQDLSKDKILVPHRTFLLVVPPAVAIARIQQRTELIPFERQAFLERVHRNYLRLCTGPRFTRLDATATIDDLVTHCVHDILREDHT